MEQERRITFCLYEHWEKLASDGNLPALKNMKRDQIAPFKNNLTLLDLRENVDEPTFQVIGADLLEDLEEDLTHKPVSDVTRRTMLSRIIDHYKEVLANRVPIAFEAEFVNNDGENALYRGILLPFSDDNENINFILGGVRWILEKDLTLDDTKPTIEELMKSIAAGKNDSRQIEDDIAARQSNDPEQMTDIATAEETGYSDDESFDNQNDVVLDENFTTGETTEEMEKIADDASDNPVEINDGIESTSSETDETLPLETDTFFVANNEQNDHENKETDEYLIDTLVSEENTGEGFDEIHENMNTEETGPNESLIEVTDDDIFMQSSGSASFEEEIVNELTSNLTAKPTTQKPVNDNSEPANTDHSIPDPIRQEEEPVSEAEPEDLEDELTLAALKSTLKQVIGYINKEDAYHNRSRDSLYNILTAIYEFHATCETSPNAYAELLKEHDLKLQSRAPFTPILKICIGKDYDKTRLTEYAAALGIARFMNIDIDEFHAFIKNFPGGIKGCVKEMRVIRKHGASGNITARKTRSIEEAREILREMAPIASFRLKKVIVGNNIDEFCLLLAKRDGHDISVLKILDNNYAKLDPVLKRAAFIKGNLNNGRK